MYYAKQIDENGNITSLHSMDRLFPEEAIDFIPITEEEYFDLLAGFENTTETDINESTKE